MTNRKMWTTKDGRKIRIKDMSNEHLSNTIRMLERAHLEAQEIPLPQFTPGSMAEYYADQQWDEIQNSDVSDLYPIYDDLVQEKERREGK